MRDGDSTKGLPENALPGDVLPGDALPGDALPGDSLPAKELTEDSLPGGLSAEACEKIAATRKWLEQVVIDLALCPFAHCAWQENQVLLATLEGAAEDSLVSMVQLLEMMAVKASPETAVLVLPQGFEDFDDYLDFLALAEALIEERGFDGEFQLASFHPDYCFDGCDIDDAANYTNRSPYPLLQVLRETSVTTAVDSIEDIDAIPERNMQLTREMGLQKMQQLLDATRTGTIR